MPTYRIVNECAVKETSRVSAIRGMYDLKAEHGKRFELKAELPLNGREWNVGLIVGPSGSGKTSLLKAAFGTIHGELWDGDAAIVEQINGKDVREVTQILGLIGFNSPVHWIKPFHALSNGEQFRVNLAQIISKYVVAVVDEFTSVVDRTVAQIASHGVGKLVRRMRRKIVCATCHGDVKEWLNPDWVLRLDASGARFEWRCLQRRPEIELDIGRVSRQAWDRFRPYHYLSGRLHRSARCWGAWLGDRLVGFCAAILFPVRDRTVTAREHRTVVLPDYQGVSIGNRLSDFVASIAVAVGYRYFSLTSHRAMWNYRNKNGDWALAAKPGIRAAGRNMNPALRKSLHSARRVSTSWRYMRAYSDAALARQMWEEKL